MTEQEIAARGVEAKQLLENKIFNEAFDAQVAFLTEMWKSEMDKGQREVLWYTLQGTESAKEMLQSFIGKGSAAAKALAERKK